MISISLAADYDYEWNPCWLLPFKNESYFCNEAVTWKISEQTFENAWEKDLKAWADYENLLSKYKEAKTTSPTSDCLAIAWDFYCAYYIPACGDYDHMEEPLCNFYCTYWVTWCPNVSLYKIRKISHIVTKRRKGNLVHLEITL